MICKKCSANENHEGEGTHKCTAESCKFNIPGGHKACHSHSRSLNVCQCCGKTIGQTRLKGAQVHPALRSERR
jgi:hypothetical protein